MIKLHREKTGQETLMRGGTLLLLVSIQCVLLLIVTVTIVDIRMRIIYDKSKGKEVCEQTEKM